MLTARSEALLKIHHTIGCSFFFGVRARAKCIIIRLLPQLKRGRLHLCEVHPRVVGF